MLSQMYTCKRYGFAWIIYIRLNSRTYKANKEKNGSYIVATIDWKKAKEIKFIWNFRGWYV